MALGEKRGASTEDSEVVEVETETAIQTFERESMRISTTPAPSNDDLGVVTPKCSNEKIRENHLRPLAVASNENDAGAQANTSMEGDVATELTPESKPTKKHKTYVEVSFEEEAVGRGERKRVTTVSAETFFFFFPPTFAIALLHRKRPFPTRLKVFVRFSYHSAVYTSLKFFVSFFSSSFSNAPFSRFRPEFGEAKRK